MPLNLTGVVGSDGLTPIYDPDARWCIWELGEIWDGSVGQGRYVPKLGDYIIEKNEYITYIVDSIDPVTLIPVLREIKNNTSSGVFTSSDMLFGTGASASPDTYRIYVDKSTTPYTMAIDSRLKVYGSMTSYCKIFKGADLGGNGQVVSMMFGPSGNFSTNNVPLELVAIDNHTNYHIKTVQPCKTTIELEDGELLTAVIYSDNGHVVSKRQLLVENTAFIRSIDVSTKYVSHISLKSPFISTTNDNLVEFPVNVPTNALNLIGVVHYSDGTTLELPVDGSKFKMLGITQYVSAIVGQELNVVLSYSLAPNEIAYTGVVSNGHYITEAYTLRTVNPNYSYSVKLYAYPEWVNETIGYRLKWWLFNLDRNVKFEVTDHIQFNPATGSYDPKDYGVTQRKSVAINLRNVSAAFKNFLHTQLVDISLYGKPADTTTAWTVSHESTIARPSYGLELNAKQVSSYVMNISNGITDQEEWLERVYLQTFPLVDVTRELQAPMPTHLQITYNGEMVEVPLSVWASNLTFVNPLSVHKNVYITFIRRSGAEVTYLSQAAMLLRP